MLASAPSVAVFGDALLRGDLLRPESRRQLLNFVPADGDLEGYGLGVGKSDIQTGKDAWGHFGAGPGFLTIVLHIPADEITVAVLSSGDANLYSIANMLVDAALEPG
jgi:CubicO group peptidase (beta-lactamase class C family)